MNIWKLAPLATLATILLAPLPSAAFSLGEINVHSYLGAPFRGSISLKTEPGEEVDIDCLSIAPPPPTEGAVYLRHAKLSLTSQNDKWRLVISGANALDEPYLIVLIQSTCQGQGRMVREYTVLIDPPSYTTAPQVMEEKPVVAVAEEKPAMKVERLADPPGARKITASPATDSSRAERPRTKRTPPPVVAQKKIAPPAPAREQKKTTPPAPAGDQLKVVSGAGNAPAQPGLTEKERWQQREKELARELDDKTAQFLAMQAQLEKLEAKLSEMHKTIELQNKMLAAMQKAPAAPLKPAYDWKDYWPVGPGILIAGLIYFFASRSRKRSLENWQPTSKSR